MELKHNDSICTRNVIILLFAFDVLLVDTTQYFLGILVILNAVKDQFCFEALKLLNLWKYFLKSYTQGYVNCGVVSPPTRNKSSYSSISDP